MTQSTDSPQLDGETVRAILDAYFASGDLDEAIAEAGPDELSAQGLFAYISESDEAQAYFDRLAWTDRALEGPDGLDAIEEPAAFEREFGDAVFEQKLDDVLGPKASSPPENGATASPPSNGGATASPPSEDDQDATIISLFGSGQGAALAAAAVAVLVAGVVLSQIGPGSNPEPDGDFQPRSAVATDDGPTFAEPDLELFCARDRGGRLAITGTDKVDGRLECPLDAELKLGYRNRSPNLAYAAFFGVDESGTIYWYGPSPAAPAPVAVEHSDAVEPVGETIRLNVNHRSGAVRVHAVLSPEPIDHDELARRLDAKSDRELWRSRRLTFEHIPSASTSTVFRVVEAETDTEEAR